MTRLRALACALLLIAGCAPAYPEQPNQPAALDLVWRQAFGASRAAPAVEWRSDCLGPQGQLGIDDRGTCDGGLYYIDTRLAVIPWLGTFHESAFAHELMHAWQADRGVKDPDHLIRADWALVAAVNVMLEAEESSGWTTTN